MTDHTTHVGVSSDGHLVEVHDPGSTGHEIDKMYAILAADDTGEGIVGVNSPDGWLPLVAAERHVIDKMLGVAQEMSNVTNRRMVMVEFSARTVLTEITPGGKQ